MDNNISALHNHCTGCGACVAVCPQDAISLAVNGKGFYVANIDSNACVNCGLCQQICIRKEYVTTEDVRNGTLLSMESKEKEVVRNCTSGGVAYELALAGFREGKTVVGTIYDFGLNCARVIIAESEEDIQAMRGSKYIQGHTDECVKTVFRLANDNPNQEFIVIGTPCQIYAYDRISKQKKMRERFLLIDLFCHGVPSSLVWECFLEEKKRKTGISQWETICFRNPLLGWHNFVLTLKSGDCTIEETSDRSLFYHAFFDNILLNSACFECPARCCGSGSDLRLGDFWGPRYQHREDGVSAVLCLTSKGRNAVLSAKHLRVIDQTSVDECMKAQSIEPYPNAELHEKAIAELQKTRDLKRTIRDYRKEFSIQRQIYLALKMCYGIFPIAMKQAIKKRIKNA